MEPTSSGLLHQTLGDKYMGKIDSETILKRIEPFLAENASMSLEQEIVQAAVSLMTIVYGPNSSQLTRFEKDIEAINMKWAGSVSAKYTHYLAAGVLRNLKAEIESGLIGTIERQ